jgi:IS30 family transposase
VVKLAANKALCDYVQDRPAGVITTPAGELVPGLEVRFIGRRHGRRADRRWARSRSPEQISNRLPSDFPDDDTMRVSHEAIYQALYVQGSRRVAPRAGRVPADRAGAAGAQGPDPRTRQEVRDTRDYDQQAPAGAGDWAVPGHWESQWCCQAA